MDMWLLFHHDTAAKVVSDGRTFVEHCPTCERQTTFDEIEQPENLGIWFIDVVGDTQRAFRCRVCRDVFDLREPPPPPRDDVADLQRRLEIEHVARNMERAARAVRVENELAELHRRLDR